MAESIKAITETINKLAETSHLTQVLLFVFGFASIAAGSVDSVPQLGIPTIDTFGHYLFLVAGALMVAVGLLSVIANVFFPPPGNGPDPDKAGVKIEAPAHDAHTLIPFSVAGKCKSLPKGYQLWLFIVGGQGEGEYSPQSEIILNDGRWATEFKATFFERGHKRKFAIFLVGKNGQALIHHYKTFGKALNQVEPKTDRRWPPLTHLTSDIVRATEIREVTLEGKMTPSAST